MPDTSSQKGSSSKSQKNCLYWLQFFLSKRTHSETELIAKLSKKGFSEEEILEQIKFAQSKRWMEKPEEIQERVVQKWHEKHKSHAWIENYLKEKGLPTIERDGSLEIKKAQHLLSKKFGFVSEDNYNKACQYLASRGFSLEDFEEAFESLNQD